MWQFLSSTILPDGLIIPHHTAIRIKFNLWRIFVEEPIAAVVRRAKKHVYVSEPFVNCVKELLKEKNLTYREAALNAGLDHQGIRRILAGQQPSLANCILLANYFGINPNEFLQLSGWPTLKVFEVEIVLEVNIYRKKQ